MSCSAALYACNTSTQTSDAGVSTTLSFGTPVRRYGQLINISSGNVSLQSTGYFDVDTNFTLSAGAGLVTIQLYKDGVAIPGASAQITAAAGPKYSVSIPCLVRNKCCCESVITAVITSVGAGTVTNAAIEVKKI